MSKPGALQGITPLSGDENRHPLQDSTNFRSQHSSSGSHPSVHEHIYNAIVYTPSQASLHSSNNTNTTIRHILSDPPPIPSRISSRSSNIDPSPLTIHQPHPLAPIPEALSTITLPSTTKPSLHRRRAFSLSLDDTRRLLSPARRPKFFSSSTSSGSPPLAACCIALEFPKQPIHLPPERPSTPPGLPRFNTPAAATYRLPPPQPKCLGAAIRTYLHLPLPRRLQTEEFREWERQTANLPRRALMRAPDGTLVRGVWRPPVSGHTGVPPRNSSRHTHAHAGRGFREGQTREAGQGRAGGEAGVDQNAAPSTHGGDGSASAAADENTNTTAGSPNEATIQAAGSGRSSPTPPPHPHAPASSRSPSPPSQPPSLPPSHNHDPDPNHNLSLKKTPLESLLEALRSCCCPTANTDPDHEDTDGHPLRPRASEQNRRRRRSGGIASGLGSFRGFEPEEDAARREGERERGREGEGDREGNGNGVERGRRGYQRRDLAGLGGGRGGDGDNAE